MLDRREDRLYPFVVAEVLPIAHVAAEGGIRKHLCAFVRRPPDMVEMQVRKHDIRHVARLYAVLAQIAQQFTTLEAARPVAHEPGARTKSAIHEDNTVAKAPAAYEKSPKIEADHAIRLQEPLVRRPLLGIRTAVEDSGRGTHDSVVDGLN